MGLQSQCVQQVAYTSRPAASPLFISVLFCFVCISTCPPARSLERCPPKAAPCSSFPSRLGDEFFQGHPPPPHQTRLDFSRHSFHAPISLYALHCMQPLRSPAAFAPAGGVQSCHAHECNKRTASAAFVLRRRELRAARREWVQKREGGNGVYSSSTDASSESEGPCCCGCCSSSSGTCRLGAAVSPRPFGTSFIHCARQKSNAQLQTRRCYTNAMASAVDHLHFRHHFNQSILGHAACKHVRHNGRRREDEWLKEGDAALLPPIMLPEAARENKAIIPCIETCTSAEIQGKGGGGINYRNPCPLAHGCRAASVFLPLAPIFLFAPAGCEPFQTESFGKHRGSKDTSGCRAV
jgi:hypothetical protein